MTAPHEAGASLEVIASGVGWLAVNKPAGLLSVPGRGPEKLDSVLTRLRVDWPEAEAPHSLDMATSGVQLVSKSKEPHRALCAVFRDRGIAKSYVAVIWGSPDAAAGEVALPIGAVWEDRPRRCVDAEGGKPALSRYRVVRSATHGSVVELEPVTGRTHQLRVHMAAIGHPILGDELYASADALAAAPRLMLHARSLAFLDPNTGGRVTVEAPPDF